jgi:hypothetical protein
LCWNGRSRWQQSGAELNQCRQYLGFRPLAPQLGGVLRLSPQPLHGRHTQQCPGAPRTKGVGGSSSLLKRSSRQTKRAGNDEDVAHQGLVASVSKCAAGASIVRPLSGYMRSYNLRPYGLNL